MIEVPAGNAEDIVCTASLKLVHPLATMGAVRLLLALVAAMAVLRGGSPAVMRMPGSEKRGRAFLRPDPASSMPMNEVVKRLPSLQVKRDCHW